MSSADSNHPRGADLVIGALRAAGVDWMPALSGNQIMPLFDACLDAEMDIIHVRQEAAAVHMADAWGRLTGQAGVAMVTAGPGFANALSAMYVAKTAESPLVVLSGHAPLRQLGRGAFQEMPQAEMALPVCKASWTASDAALLGDEVAKALRIAQSGRPGPVHLALPFDLLEERVAAATPSALNDTSAHESASSEDVVRQIIASLREASRPLVLAGPALARGAAVQQLAEFATAARVPAIAMESPRGINDPSRGALAEVLLEADLIMLLGKRLDFTLQKDGMPAAGDDCKFIHVDAEDSALAQAARVLDAPARMILSTCADPAAILQKLAACEPLNDAGDAGWLAEVEAALALQPSELQQPSASSGSAMHAAEACRVVQEFLDQDPNAIYISDGGEFGQWAQACLRAPRRIINGPSGSIGSAIPFALAARRAFPDARLVTLLGDGTFGFHALEFDTAVRYDLPLIAVVGNDAAWNAEYQIQLRKYGRERLIGCELLPTRYDRLVESLGGFGRHADNASSLAGALDAAWNSKQPACINVAIERNPAPVIRRVDGGV